MQSENGKRLHEIVYNAKCKRKTVAFCKVTKLFIEHIVLTKYALCKKVKTEIAHWFV